MAAYRRPSLQDVSWMCAESVARDCGRYSRGVADGTISSSPDDVVPKPPELELGSLCSRDLTLCALAAIRRAGAAGIPAMSNIAGLVTAGERQRNGRNWRTFGSPRLPPSATNGTGKAPVIWLWAWSMPHAMVLSRKVAKDTLVRQSY